jgi:cyanophycin synthetase
MLELKVMRGPNYWSNNRKKLIVVKLDLEELEREPTHKIDGFYERLKAMMPSLSSHRCSEGHQGGFFERVQQGTWMGHVIEHLALELQTLAGMFVGYGRTRSTDTQGVYYVVFAYKIEEAGVYAAEAAIRMAEALSYKKPFDVVREVEHLKRLKRRFLPGLSTISIIEEAEKRNIPFKRLNKDNLVVFGHGCKQQKIMATISDTTSGIGISIAKDKYQTKMLLHHANIPVPRGVLVYNEEEVMDAIREIGFPLVMKPYNGNHGRGITTNITHEEQALTAFSLAERIARPVIMERFVNGDDYRLLLVDYKLVAASRRTPAMVTGNGRSTIAELVDAVNSEPLRGEGHDNILTRIEVDEITQKILTDRNLTLDSVIADGEKLPLKDTANLSSGGTSEDVTDQLHPYNIFLAERVARMLKLNICGIDIVALDLRVSMNEWNSAVVEVNAGPGLRMHHYPSGGLARNVAKPIVEMMFPGKDDGRIPLVAITGTNGKTTTTRLVAHLAGHAGYKAGYSTSDGIYIQGYKIYEGDCTGPVSAGITLLDPTIDFAVLECARGGIIRAGLGFDTCDISIITNISADHIGLKDINSVEEMAKVKSVVARTTRENGYAILNADDDLVWDMGDDLDCNLALFSMQHNNNRVLRHCERGGLAAIVEEGYVVVCQGKWKTRIEKVTAIPITFRGRSTTMLKNVLPAVLAGIISNLSIEIIRGSLLSFLPSVDQTPGRMNLFKFRKFEVLVDYAHNVNGYEELKKFVDKTKATVKVGVICANGDRRDEDIRMIGRLSAEMFDEIIIKSDRDRGERTGEEITGLLIQGIGQKQVPYKIIPDENEAIAYALSHSVKGAFVVVCADDIAAVINQVSGAREKERFETKKAAVPGKS